MKMSAVAKVSPKASGMNEPVPITSTGARAWPNILHLNGVNPLEPTMRAELKPAASRVWRILITLATDTPVPNSTLRTRSLTMLSVSESYALAHHRPHRLVLVQYMQPVGHQFGR